jgi:hypothetical protein
MNMAQSKSKAFEMISAGFAHRQMRGVQTIIVVALI